MRIMTRSALALGLTLGLAACLDQTPLDPTLWEHLDVVEDSVVLDARVTYLGGEELPVLAAADAAGGGPSYTMKQVARVDPPVVAGVQLQASHLVRDGSRAFVAYNVRGEVFRGGIDVFDKLNDEDPRLRAQALLYDSEVSAVDLSGGDLYLATATADESFRTPAVLEVMSVANGAKALVSQRRVELSSFAGTGVKVYGGEIYATSGSSGHLTVFDRSLNPIFTDALSDARAVDVTDRWIVAMRGTPGMLRVYDRRSRSRLRDITLGGASTPNAKSSLFVLGDLAFAATGDGGVVVANVATGEIVERVPAPRGPGVSVSNGLAWYKDLLFVANGEGGLWMAEARTDLDRLGNGAPGFEIVGRIDLKGSANFVDVKGDLLFVATGLAGLTIVEFDD